MSQRIKREKGNSDDGRTSRIRGGGRQSREEEEFRYRFPKGQGLQTDDQCPKALSDYLKIN